MSERVFERANHQARSVADRFASARAIADAVLFEGYVLYPYRASSSKNQLRWQFGVVVPRAVSDRDPSERSVIRTECVVDPGDTPTVTVRLRCLQIQHRTIEVPTGGDSFAATDRLELDGAIYVPWDEAIDRTVDLDPVRLLPLGGAHLQHSFQLPPGEDVELLHDASGAVAGRLVRRREAVDGQVTVHATWADGGGALIKVAVTVENTSDWIGEDVRRDAMIGRSLVAMHTMLGLDDGRFASMLDPPAGAEEAVAGCANEGTFPVLVGAGNDVMLSSPIILYDQPEIAPESPGDLYDSTEVDEILALRVLTLTDEEKAEARGTDPRAAAIVDRCDDMPPELWSRLHGAVRSLQPATTPDPPTADAPPPETGEQVPWWDPEADASVDPWGDSISVGGVLVAQGSAVRLRPSHRADAHDIFLDGMAATVAGVFRDVDGNEHVAVTVDDDPATEALAWQGRYLFFHPDEVEPLERSGSGT